MTSYKGVQQPKAAPKGVTQPKAASRGLGPDTGVKQYGQANTAASTYRSTTGPLTGAKMAATGSHLSVSTSKLLAKRGTNGPNG